MASRNAGSLIRFLDDVNSDEKDGLGGKVKEYLTLSDLAERGNGPVACLRRRL